MVGQNIGKYRVLDRIGRGGMGTVFRALDETLHREVAIKVLNAELNDPEVARRFRAEAVTVARLNHPGIATIFEFFQHDGQWLMVMEFVRGETLERLIERLGPLSPQRAADLVMQALTALSHAHAMGVVHRDLKPANIMVTESGSVKVMDFGIARVAGAEHLTSAGFMMGTPAYMAPEQVMGNEIDARTDLYAVGCVFYYLVSGKLPFKGDTPMAMAQSRINDQPTPVRLAREGLPNWIEPVIDRSLSKAPEDRFQTSDQFREALRRGLAGLPMEMSAGSSIPAELVATTPPRAMPIGPPTPFRTATTSTAAEPVSTGSQPTALSSSALGTSSQPGGATGGAQTSLAPVKKSNTGILALAGVVVLVIAGVAWNHFRKPETPDSSVAVPPAPAPVVPSAATSPTPAPIDTPGAAPVGTGPSPTTAAPSPTPAVPAATPGATGPTGTTTGGPSPTSTASPTPSPGAPGTRGTPTPTPGAARGPAEPISAHLAFNSKREVITGKKADDEDVTVNFVDGKISVIPKRGGAAVWSLTYRMVLSATYVHAKDPRWEPALPSPPNGIDFPAGMFAGRRHWLTLQSKTDYIILKLEDGNFQKVIDAVRSRTPAKYQSLGDK